MIEHPSITFSKQSQVIYPTGHKLGMVVPTGGSDCEKCEYVSGQQCSNRVFVKWNGSETIPAPTNKYCCDLFETSSKFK